MGPPDLTPRFNIAPSQEAPVVIDENGRRLELFHWGLIPPWAESMKLKFSTINARAENLMESKIYKRPFEKARCLVPSTGFYEWQLSPGAKNKIPMRIALESKEPFAMAGLWEKWKNPKDDKEVRSFTIITTAANKVMEPIHKRMPVILPRDAEDQWLDPKADVNRLLPLLQPYKKNDLVPYEVSKLVNSPANDKPECIEKA